MSDIRSHQMYGSYLSVWTLMVRGDFAVGQRTILDEQHRIGNFASRKRS